MIAEHDYRRVGYNVIFEFRCDPAAVRAELPEPLKCDGSGQVIVWFQQHHDFGGVPSGDFADPSAKAFSEAVWKIPCTYEGKDYNYTFLARTDSEALVEKGRRSGIPQQLAGVHVTELHPADPAYDRPREGLTIRVKVAGCDQLSRGSVELQTESSQESLPFRIGASGPNIGRRYLYDSIGEKVLLNDLSGGWTLDWRMTDLWTGPASWEQTAFVGDPFNAFAPREVVAGYYFLSEFDGSKPNRSIVHTFTD